MSENTTKDDTAEKADTTEKGLTATAGATSDQSARGDGRVRKTNWWVVIQTVCTILTPIVIVVAGYFVDKKLSDLQRPLVLVEKVTNLIDPIGQQKNSCKSKMAAHALYLVTNDRPKLLVRMLLSSGREDLKDVLREIARDDPEVRRILSEELKREAPGPSTRAKQDVVQHTAAEVLKDVLPSAAKSRIEWCYLGAQEPADIGMEWVSKTIDIDEYATPKAGDEYEASTDIWLRNDKPEIPDYKLATAVGLVKKGTKMKIKKIMIIPSDVLNPNIVSNPHWRRYWGKVQIISSPKE